MENETQSVASSFVLDTGKSVFLTGRAGTGKTTFLKEVLKKTKKQTIVVAPTGVAAINAGGTTIHSMFQLPNSGFLPTNAYVDHGQFITPQLLGKNQRIKQSRRQLLIELELLIIDEISMVRADLLDALDATLRRIRKINSPFGGVQLLVIGDLFQLAPVVKSFEWHVLSEFYNSPFFFDSLAWKKTDHVCLELKKVYRQEDEDFISILNNIRTGKQKDLDLDVLNQRYKPNAVDQGIISLTTHNKKAKVINERALEKLGTPLKKLNAFVSGKFSESAYPALTSIHLKVGAQVMFIKNHPDGLYYNGKLGTVQKVLNDKIIVQAFGEDHKIDVVKEKWKNLNYKFNGETKEIEAEEVGFFEQYPLRLAWAVTIHKSQGLTFNEVNLDLEDSFAPGQLYVALSRCRSLEGITLTSLIKPNNIIVDKRIVGFYSQLNETNGILDILEQAKKMYTLHQIQKAFSLEKILSYSESWESYIIDSKAPSKGDALIFSKEQLKQLYSIQDVVLKFQKQLSFLFKENETDHSQAIERMSKAIGFFTEHLHSKIILPFESHIKEWKAKSKSKAYVKNAVNLASAYWDHVERLYRLQFHDSPIFDGPHKLKRSTNLSAVKKKRVVGETYKITYALFRDGKSIKEIAEERQLAIGTIEAHMTKFIKEGKVEISELLDQSKLEKMLSAVSANLSKSDTDIIKNSVVDMSYNQVRWVKSWLALQEEKKEAPAK